ncbi:hypothetical protein M446_7019 (plasmid) [Methylobacterium sp. 4-46]|uniref:hypothetical protein n=1 Tax=unclassified Methylobacterium TaxID=2615210 RepID=UPI000152E89F|nr:MULTISPECIES: hypothetical protein [Methylobacterium]ACA21243.1 hypothetical protein M446_7019 [Methylobacterium sp. 4-46]WFT83806.1 hypothetical protein QA634_35325 [Methylobacterium nodulans]
MCAYAGSIIFSAKNLCDTPRWSAVEARGGPTSVNPRSGAFGIAQWLSRDRLAPIRGNTDFDAQLRHALHELHTTERRALAKLNSAKTPFEAATGASMFERAEGYNARTGVDLFTGRTAAAMGGLKVGPPGEPVQVASGGDVLWYKRDRYYPSKAGGYSRLRDDEVVNDLKDGPPSQKIAMSRVGDDMMQRRFNSAGASAGSGKGHLHITMDGFPTGTRARASVVSPGVV